MESVAAKKYLFWDTSNVDLEKNQRFVVERILLYGDKDDFLWAKKFYGEKKIKQIFLHSRKMDGKSNSFWKQYFKIAKNNAS